MSEQPYKNSELSTGTFQEASDPRPTNTQIEDEGLHQEIKLAEQLETKGAGKAGSTIQAYIQQTLG